MAVQSLGLRTVSVQLVASEPRPGEPVQLGTATLRQLSDDGRTPRPATGP